MKITHEGQRVQIKLCPDHKGTVIKLGGNGSFRVAYDSPSDRRSGTPRMRVWCQSYQADGFQPATQNEVRRQEWDE